MSTAKATTTPKLSNTQKQPQLIGNDVPKYSVPDAGFQLSKSTSKPELSGNFNVHTKTYIQKSHLQSLNSASFTVVLNKENSDAAIKQTLSFGLNNTKDTKPKPESIGFGIPNDNKTRENL